MAREQVVIGDAPWKVPFWQEPVRQDQLALHEDGPLAYAKREGYLQKRAGRSRLRWNIRFFELKEGKVRWWRPGFKDQVLQPRTPKVALREPRPKPVRCLDLTQLQSVTRTRVKFPYSTRILLRFRESYTDYQLELRSERELEIMEWYKIFLRFTIERYELEVERAEEETQAGTEPHGLASDSDGDALEVRQPEDERPEEVTAV